MLTRTCAPTTSLLCLGLSLLLAGCGQDCSLIGCFESFSVQLEPAVSSTYDVEVEVDGARGAFTCELSSQSRWRITDVVGEASFDSCDGSGLYFGSGVPQYLAVSVVARDGTWTGSASGEPTIENYYPNGPDCDPFPCQRAKFTVPQQRD
jgi:hypothetical protein